MPRASMALDLPDGSATEALGRSLGRALPAAMRDASGAGAVLYLHGELGAGKTTCVRSLLRALSVAGTVRSPTYTLVETYVVPALTCAHVDLYRLQTPAEVEELGLRDLAGPGCLMLVEWPERGGAALPAADLELWLSYAGEARRAEVRPRTLLGVEWLDNLDTTLA